MSSRACARCGSRMLLARSDAVYCSTACRVAALRARRRAAVVPAVMQARRRFVRVGRTKAPLQVDGRPARSNDPGTWADFATASTSPAGIGLGFVTGAGIACFDFDDCLDAEGKLHPHAVDVVADRLAGCIRLERSMSGRGLHVWFLADEAPGWRRTIDGQKVERYAGGQYVALGTAVEWADLVEAIGV